MWKKRNRKREIEREEEKMHVLEVKDLIRNYQKTVGKKSEEDIKVLKGLDFSVEEGEFVGIMGNPAAGKRPFSRCLG